jgi:hypothetical protein
MDSQSNPLKYLCDLGPISSCSYPPYRELRATERSCLRLATRGSVPKIQRHYNKEQMISWQHPLAQCPDAILDGESEVPILLDLGSKGGEWLASCCGRFVPDTSWIVGGGDEVKNSSPAEIESRAFSPAFTYRATWVWCVYGMPSSCSCIRSGGTVFSGFPTLSSAPFPRMVYEFWSLTLSVHVAVTNWLLGAHILSSESNTRSSSTTQEVIIRVFFWNTKVPSRVHKSHSLISIQVNRDEAGESTSHLLILSIFSFDLCLGLPNGLLPWVLLIRFLHICFPCVLHVIHITFSLLWLLWYY